MKKADFIIIAAVMLLAAVIFFLTNFKDKDSKKTVYVKYDNSVYSEYSLDKNGQYDIKTEKGFNHLVIYNSSCYIDDADCENRVCINTGAISKSGEVIVCLPHKIVVYVE